MLKNPLDRKYKNLRDEELVGISLENKEKFYYLIKRYERKLLRYIKRTTDITQQESEDILQDIFIKVYCNLNAFNQSLKFSSWVYRITRNEITNFYHKNKPRKKMLSLKLEDNDIYNLSQFIGDKNDPLNNLILQEKMDTIREILTKLPNKYREILVLRYLEDKKYDEISDILRKPPGTVATLINRAKSRFKKMVKCDIKMVNDERYK